MATYDLGKSTQTNMSSTVSNYSVNSSTIDQAGVGETVWNNQNWSTNLGYYKHIPELKKAVDALGMWTCGKGYKTDNQTRVILEHITGWGEDSFDSILQNMIVVKKINGDSYAEIIKDEKTNTLLNLKPINPASIRHIVNDKGILIRYEEYTNDGKMIHKYKPNQIFHLCNDRIANEIHGVSVVDACKWIIDAKNEAMGDWRRILHRSTIRVLYVDVDDTTRLTQLRTQYAEAIKNGEVWIIPAKRGEAELVDYVAPPVETFLAWIRYLENFFYQALGIPKIILGGSQEFTEASSKVGYLTFEQVYMSEQRLLEQDLWNQLQIRIEFNRPISLKEQEQTDEAKNTGQVGFQANELLTGVQRNE